MSGELALRNRQRTCTIDLQRLRRLTRALLRDAFLCQRFELCLHLVAAPEMARLNEQFRGHKGSTDVIAFDYSLGVPPSGGSAPPASLCGEVFICLDDAVAQARQYGTTWQSELVRYLIHGLLHLRGYDDRKPAARRKMKSEEDRLLRQAARSFALSRLGTRRGKPSRRRSVA